MTGNNWRSGSHHPATPYPGSGKTLDQGGQGKSLLRPGEVSLLPDPATVGLSLTQPQPSCPLLSAIGLHFLPWGSLITQTLVMCLLHTH